MEPGTTEAGANFAILQVEPHRGGKVINSRIILFIKSLIRPYVLGRDLEIAYQQMARDQAREAGALEWAEATMGDAADEAR